MRNSNCYALTVSLVLMTLAGCGQKPEKPSQVVPPSVDLPTLSESELKVSKWVRGVSNDAFFADPLLIASKTDLIAKPDQLMTEASTETSSSQTDEPESTSTIAETSEKPLDWADIISAEDLIEESKIIRTRLTANLQTIGTYNRSVKEVSLDGAMLAALASVARLNSGHISWKAKSHFVRDLAARISSQASEAGRNPFSKCKLAFDQLIVVMDGGNPADPDVSEEEKFGDSIYVADIMKKLEASLANLRANVNTPARLEEQAESAHRELAVLSMLGTMILDESYDSSDEELYQKYSKEIVQGAKDAIIGVKEQNLTAYQAGLAKIQNTCAPCHQEYRGSESSFK